MPGQTPEQLDRFMREAAARGYKIVKKTDGSLSVSPASKLAKDPEFAARLKRFAPALKASMKPPARKDMPAVIKQIKHEGVIERMNNYINHMRDKYAAPALGTAVQALSGTAPSGGLDPDATAIADEALKMVAPDSFTGKVVSGLTLGLGGPIANMAEKAVPAIRAGREALGLTGPISRALTSKGAMRVAAPALVGAGAGAVSGEGMMSGAAQGGFVGLASEAGRLPGVAKKIGRYLTREGTTQKMDNIKPGQDLEPIINLKSYSQALAGKAMNWVNALRSSRVGIEAGTRYEGHIDDIQNALTYHLQTQLDDLKDAFNQRWDIGPEGQMPPKLRAGQGGNIMGDEFNDSLRAYKAERARVKEQYVDVHATMKKMRTERSQAFDHDMRLKKTATAQEHADAWEETKGALRQSLNDIHPGLAEQLDSANDEYSRFSALRDLADKPEALMNDDKDVNLKSFQEGLLTHPRNNEPRMKEQFKDISDILRRNAPPVEGSDRPGTLKRIRLSGYGTRGHLIADLPTLLNPSKIVGKPIGELTTDPAITGGPAYSLLPKQAPVPPPTNTNRFLLGSTANRMADESRGE